MAGGRNLHLICKLLLCSPKESCGRNRQFLACFAPHGQEMDSVELVPADEVPVGCAWKDS